MNSRTNRQLIFIRTVVVVVAAVVASMAFIAGLAPVSAAEVAKKSAGGESVESQLRFMEGDETGNELKAIKTEMLVMKSEKRALAQLLKLQKKYKGTRMEPDILFRLAEIHMRRARSHRFFEVHRESDQVMSFAPTLVKEASEAREIKRAISYYDEMQKKFPTYRNMDIVIFNTAFARQQLGDDKAAEELFARIVNEHSNSALVPDSYLAIGEINYNKRRFAVALENFQKVKKYPKARVYPYGLYKAAWCHYNMQDAQSAMRQLEEVVRFGRLVAAKNLDSKLDLRKEALNDLATFFGDVYDSNKAVDYFIAQSDGLDASPVLMRLAGLYNRHSRYKDVETILKGHLKRLPNSDQSSTVHEELVWNYERMRHRQSAVVQLSEMSSYCQTLPTPKAVKKDSPPPDLRGTCLSKVADVSKQLATKWHGLWKKKQPTEELASASEQAYRMYLENGSAARDPDLAKIRFQYAEILFQLKKFREASAQYALVEGAKPDLKLSHDAAYAAVVALEKANDNKWNDEDEKLFVLLSGVYLGKHPKGEFALELQFKRAFIAYDKGRYDEAGAGFKAIGWNNPVTEQTKERVLKAQDLYLDILNIKKDYGALKEAAQSLVERGSQDGTRLQAVEKIYREAYFAEVQQMEDKGDLKGAVDAYKKFALANKSSELASKAWWNASQLQFRLGDAQGGAATCHQMHKPFPQSPMGKDCLTKAAQTFEASGRLEQAARVLLNLALVDEKQTMKWREVSADFFALSGHRERAVEMYIKLAHAEKAAPSQLRLYQKAAEVEKQSKNDAGYRKVQAKIATLGLEPTASAIQMDQAEQLFTRGDMSEAFALSRKVLGRSLPKDLLARARFLQARILEDEFRKQSVRARLDRIAMVLATKTEKLEKSQRAYREAIKYGDPEVSVKSLRHLADAYMHYVQSIREMPMPSSLSEADLQAFKGELDTLVIPMEEKGIDTLNQALQAARKFRLHDGTVADIQNDINKANMKPTTTGAVRVIEPGVVLPNFSGTSSKEVGT